MAKKPRTPLEAIETVLADYGSQQRLATALGKKHQSYVGELLKRLRNGSKVPPDICPAIEKLTAGKVTRQMLRPDLWAA
jgi:DNA-binding transcriptional regulator YdaS (Cro superfamily)